MIEYSGKESMTFDEWLLYGITRDWTSPPICEIHDGFAKTKEELEAGSCVHYTRLYKNLEAANKVMDEFPPASWRSHTRGLEWED
jgi:hypothetical protein